MNHFDLQAYLRDLTRLCAIDSGHHNGPGAEAMADFFEERYRELGFQTERRHYRDNTVAPFLLVSNSREEEIDVLFLAHMDTVFPVGTAEAWPLTETAPGIVSGPGCADCKGGCLLLYYTIKALQEAGKLNFRFRIAMNSDEERRSDYSRAYFEEMARHTKYCFVYEPGRPLDEFVGQGSIIGELCHFFDLACYIIGKEPVKIYTEGWSRTNMSVTIQFEDKSICTIFDASNGSFDHPKELIEI